LPSRPCERRRSNPEHNTMPRGGAVSIKAIKRRLDTPLDCFGKSPRKNAASSEAFYIALAVTEEGTRGVPSILLLIALLVVWKRRGVVSKKRRNNFLE
ncbi:MAG: hypothetical protein RR280_07865, partial [Bacteroidaceae bacterium]